MKHAIIPTDLSIASLQSVHDVMNHYDKGMVKITLLHFIDIPTGIGDLLFRLRRLESRYPMPNHYQHAVEVLINRYGNRLVRLQTRLEWGSTPAVLSNHLDALRADAVFLQPGASFTAPFEESINLYQMIPATGFPIINTSGKAKATVRNNFTISDLLLADG